MCNHSLVVYQCGRFTSHGALRGQTLIYLLTVMAMLMIMALWLFDMNTGITLRIRAQNAADGSALAAAQWQARSLNAIGEINLIKAINTLLDNVPPGTELQDDLSSSDPSNAFKIIQDALDSLQARIEFVGPMLAMVAAQQSAKNNGIPDNELYTDAVREHADVVELTYSEFYSAPQWGDEGWVALYARMLRYQADEGIAAACDNVHFYYGDLSASPQAWLYLLNSKAFYQAIASRNWCFLEDLLMLPYEDYSYWGPITPLPQSTTGSEYFGLGLEFISSDNLVGAGGLSASQFEQLRPYFVQELEKRNLLLHTDWPQFVPKIQWAAHSDTSWSVWENADFYRASLVADPRPPYHYSGCDAVTAIRVRNDLALASLAVTNGNWSSWLVGKEGQTAVETSVSHLQHLEESSELDVRSVAAAKPFGQLPDINEPAYTFRIVLPIYENVRLIPIALASESGNSDPEWLNHRLVHLPYDGPSDSIAYTLLGPNSLPDDCFYCQQLKTWENAAFRQEGIDWLTATDPETGQKLHDCTTPVGGGGGGGTGSPPIAH